MGALLIFESGIGGGGGSDDDGIARRSERISSDLCAKSTKIVKKPKINNKRAHVLLYNSLFCRGVLVRLLA